MLAIHFRLFVYVHTLFGLCQTATAATEAVGSAQLLSDDFVAFGNYEVLSMREEGDEDVVHIRKRADEEECESDCMTYSGWTEDGVMHCKADNVGSEDEEDAELEEDAGVEDMPMKRAMLEKRRKPINPKDACAKITVDGAPRTGFHLISPTWGSPEELEERHKDKGHNRVYDTGNPTEPFKSEWFKMETLDKGWGADLPGKPKNNRCYDAEHVLEWHLLKEFLQEDKDDKDGRCAHMYRFFLQDIVPQDPEVKVAKDDGKLNGEHFAYEDKVFPFSSGWDVKIGQNPVKPRAIDYISHQWPGKATGGPNNPWEYEMVLLVHEANGKKENVWNNKELFVKPKPDKSGGMTQTNRANSKTLEWLFEDKYYDGIQKQPQYWKDHKGKCKAVYQYNTLMALVQYHNDPYIREVMRAQVSRVAEAWDLMETKVLVGAKSSTNGAPFKAIGLKKQWLDFMTRIHKERLDRLQSILDQKIDIFHGKPGIVTRLKRWDYGGVFRRATKPLPEPRCGFEPDSNKMEQRVKLLIDAKTKLTASKSELKLD